MDRDNLFKPPVAPVADFPVRPRLSRAPVIALACVTALLSCWIFAWRDFYSQVLQHRLASPVGLVAALSGVGCMLVGAVRATPRGLAGQKSFLAAIALLSTASVFETKRVSLVYVPFNLAGLLAVCGFWLVQARRRANKQAP